MPWKPPVPRKTRIARFIPHALIGQSLEAGVLLARRFGHLKSLPEHPLFPAIHGRLIAGESPYRLARWIQANVPIDDPLGAGELKVESLEQKLRRYRALMPRHTLIPMTHIDEMTNGAVIEIDVVKELTGLILYQKQRIDQFAKREMNFPLGMTSEQQRREVITLRDLLTTMRDTQIALGLVPGHVPNTMLINQTTVNLGATAIDDPVATDPLSTFLGEYPSAIPAIMDAIDGAIRMDDWQAVNAGSDSPPTDEG